MNTCEIKAPLSAEDVLKLKAGDIAYLNGLLFTLRDAGHKKALNVRSAKIPGNVLYHCGPLMKKECNSWKVVSAGPTTSARMDSIEPEFIKRFGIRAIIGKGGVGDATRNAMKGRCVYLAYPGGCGALAARQLSFEGVEWLGLGMPEAMWRLRAESFGPLVVAVDARGKTLYERKAMPV